jgi:hypothetical protein
MLKEENIYILNLEHRKDRLLFTKIKMYRAGFDLEKINFIKAVYGKKDSECVQVFNSLPIERRKSGMCQPINNIGALGLLKTYRNILKDAKEKDLDYVALVEDDNYFHPKLIERLKESVKFFDKNDVIWVGSNQCMYLPEQIKKINSKQNYNLGNGHIAGTFFIMLSKRMYLFIYNYLEKNFRSNIYPIDVLLDIILKKNNWSALILYPRPVIPEIRDSDNMGPRNHIMFYNSRQMKNFEEYDYINLYEIFCNYYDNFTFEMYKEIYDKLETDSIRLLKNKLGNCPLDITYKIFEQNNNTFHFIIEGNFSINEFIESLEKQNYKFWRITFITTSKNNIDYINNSIYKNKIKLINNKEELNFDNDEVLTYLNYKCKFTLPIILQYINNTLKNNVYLTGGYKENGNHNLKDFKYDSKLIIFGKGKYIFSEDELNKKFHSRLPLLQR